jgi:type IV pilus assembly protein PilQ
MVHIGKVPTATQQPATAAVAEKEMVAQKPSEPAAAEKQSPQTTPTTTTVASGKPAWVNRIDFSSEEAGKSSLIIGTTVAVKYDLKKVGAKRLHLKLFNTRLPEYRKRALITTRFESAVDRVTPIQTAEMKGDSLFTIELREAVAYNIKQDDNTLRVNFAASSIPPKPYEDADLPEWKKVMAEAAPASARQVEKDKIAPAPGKKAAEKLPAEKAAEAQTAEERLAAQTSSKKFTGEKIALDFFDTDIKNVFRILREISGKNFAIDKNVTGKVTLTLEKPAPWDQVLDLVLKMNQLGMTRKGDVIRIATLSTLAQEEKLKQAQLKAAEQALKQAVALEPLYTEYIPISYSNASTEVLPHVEAILTDGRGKANVDTRNNQIIITDTAVKIKQAKQIVQKIDKVTPQVIIEARVIEANTSFTREIGFDWGYIGFGGGLDHGPIDVPYTSSWKAGPTQFITSNRPAGATPAGAIQFNLFKTSGTNFQITEAWLTAEEVEDKINIISSPRVVTLDNKKAKIMQGFEIPYLERDDSGNATIKFKDVDLLLEVTPTVSADNRIRMSIFVTKNDLVDPDIVPPALATNEAQTEILVDNGDTIVIGGILKSTIAWDERGTPGLRNLGVLGWLFKDTRDTDEKKELLIFLTPQIVQLEQKRLS